MKQFPRPTMMAPVVVTIGHALSGSSEDQDASAASAPSGHGDAHDDDHVVLWADDGGGDLPAKHGDFLLCRIPDGVCRVTVPRSSQAYVAPYLSYLTETT